MVRIQLTQRTAVSPIRGYALRDSVAYREREREREDVGQLMGPFPFHPVLFRVHVSIQSFLLQLRTCIVPSLSTLYYILIL